MSRAYADPTGEAAERNEELPCGNCRWLDHGFGDKWCAHPQYDCREAQRPSTWAGARKLHRCAWHEPRATSPIFVVRKEQP